MAVKPRPPLSPEAFQALTGVCDDTLARLAAYVELLGKWQRRINLVGRGTLADVWRRHVLDSAQLLPLLPADARAVLDLGSGAGFPGLVLAVSVFGLSAMAAPYPYNFVFLCWILVVAAVRGFALRSRRRRPTVSSTSPWFRRFSLCAATPSRPRGVQQQ